MNGGTLTPKKRPAPVVRVTYTLTAANGNKITDQNSNYITAKY
jgi:hypothetical protein